MIDLQSRVSHVPPGPHAPKPAPPPLQVDTVRVVLIGTALWAVALVVLLFFGWLSRRALRHEE